MMSMLESVLSEDLDVLRMRVNNERGDFSVENLVQTAKESAKIRRRQPQGRHVVGRVFSAAGYLMPPFNLTETITKLVTESGAKACDLSPSLHPRMTFNEVKDWQVKLFERCRDFPDTVFFVTCDCVSSIEAILHIDDETKASALLGFVRYVGDAQGYAWRGEDYVRIAGVGKTTTAESIAQTMKALTEPDRECCICMEVINDVPLGPNSDGSLTGNSHFTCLHTICRRCYDSTKDEDGNSTMASCPVCRSTHTVNAIMSKYYGMPNATKPKNKKQERAARRRGR